VEFVIKTKRCISKKIFGYLNDNPNLKLAYLRLATFLGNFGIRPPLTGSSKLFLNNWSNQSEDNSTYNPSIYIKEDNSLDLLFNEVIDLIDKEDNILEVGCNCGRSLNYLFKKGFSNLHGIEIGAEAVELMKKTFPDMYEKSKIEVGNAPEVLRKHDSEKYKLVFCHSVLVNIPTSFNYVFEEMARISNKYIVTLESEASFTSYPRDFQKMFENHGYKMVCFKYFVADKMAGQGLKYPDNWNTETELMNNVLRIFVKK
jgi:hypothetical protein